MVVRSPRRLSPENSEDPQIRALDGGGAVAVWREIDPGTGAARVVVRSIGPDGTLGARVVVARGTGDFGEMTVESPLIQLSGGRFAVAFRPLEGGPVHRQILDAALRPVGPSQPVDFDPGWLGQVVVLDDDRTLTVSGDGIVSLYDAEMNLLSSVATGEDLRNAGLGLDGNRLVIVDDTASGMQLMRFAMGSGTLLQNPTLRPDVAMGFRDPNVAALGDGTAVIVVSQRNGIGAAQRDSVHVSRIDLETGGVISERVMTSAPGEYMMSDAVVATPDGGFAVLVHRDMPSQPGDDRFFVQRYDANGVPRGTPELVATGMGSTNNGGYDHELSVMADGQLLVVWQTLAADGNREGGILSAVLTPVWNGTQGADTLVGGADDDLISGYGGNDMLAGGAGHDTLDGGAGTDRIDGGAGFDTVLLTGPSIRLDLSAGWIDQTRNVEAWRSGAGDDRMIGDSGANSLATGAGRDTLRGAAGDDALWAGAGEDLIWADAGNDRIDGSSGIDTLAFSDSVQARVDLAVAGQQFTGVGRDTISGVENLIGGAGNDLFLGNAGGNLLQGREGNDMLHGRAGDDRLQGGAGHDVLVGGSGADRFVFDGGRDTITDFADNDDMIILARSVLTDSTATVDDILDRATADNDSVTIWLGNGNSLTLAGVRDPLELADDLIIL